MWPLLPITILTVGLAVGRAYPAVPLVPVVTAAAPQAADHAHSDDQDLEGGKPMISPPVIPRCCLDLAILPDIQAQSCDSADMSSNIA